MKACDVFYVSLRDSLIDISHYTHERMLRYGSHYFLRCTRMTTILPRTVYMEEDIVRDLNLHGDLSTWKQRLPVVNGRCTCIASTQQIIPRAAIASALVPILFLLRGTMLLFRSPWGKRRFPRHDISLWELRPRVDDGCSD